MKIVCEACGAKYSIADDRVAGKVFKIRCKRCSEVIVVRGDEQQAAAAQPNPQPGYGAGAEAAIWHVVIDGEQAGPYAPSQLGEMLSAGSVTWEAYVWCEGFDNWSPMRDVADLVAQITGQGGGQSAAEPAYAHAASSTLTGQPSMGADPFADDRDGGGFGGRSAGPDLFGSSQDVSSPFSQDSGAVVASAPSPRVSPESAMTGARNENSVLFSLKNLQALATGSPSAPPVSSSMSSDRNAGGGFAAGEGSGLIDIRALATATGMGDGGGGGARDELLSIGSQGGAFGALGSPILSGTNDDGDGDKKTYIWAGVAAVGVLAIAGVAIAYIMTRQPAAGMQQQVQLVPPTPQVVAPVAPVGPNPTSAPTEGELAAQQAKQNEPGSGSGSDHHSSSGHRRDSDKGEPKSPEAAPTRSTEPSEPVKPSKPSGPRTIDDLLDGALNSSAKPGKPAASAPAADLPQSPARDAVMSAMNSVKGDVQACAKGETGVATVAVSIAGSTGRVTSAQVVTGPAGPVGSCIAQAVRKAQFPKFQQSVFKLSYPFKL